MKSLFLLTVCCLSLPGQTLTFSVHDNTGATPDIALPSAYQFPSTPQGSAASIMVKITNTGADPVELVGIFVGASAGSVLASPNFSIYGLQYNYILAPAGSEYFVLSFTPSITGQLIGYMQASYAVQQSGCVFGSSASGTACGGGLLAVSTLQGTGTAPQMLLTYKSGQANVSPQPNSTTAIDFGQVSTSSTSSIVFTLANQTSSPIATPAVSVQSGVFGSSAFSLDTSALPKTLAANGSGTFTITFAPSTVGLTAASEANLVVGSNSYGIEGTGIVVSSIDALAISYVDSTGVRTLPQAATPISFGQLVPGSAGGSTLKFTVTNPATSFDAVTVSTLSVNGAAYTLTGPPALPATIQPNASITFSITFSASASGSYSGTLTIGTRAFTLTGLAVVSPVPAMSLQLSQQLLTSAQQVNLTVEAATPATQTAYGNLTMQFKPLVNNVQDDPAIVFLANNSRSLSLVLAAGSQTATYNGQSALTFQTGTTAGTITFTLTFINTPPVTETFTITPTLIHISSGQAIRQSPNLVVTLDGFDNTYTAGQLSFTFFDTKGAQMNMTPMPVDASSDFHQYFFTNDFAGGSFALQASFPVKGDATQVGSVAVTMTNSAGQTSTKLTFQ